MTTNVPASPEAKEKTSRDGPRTSAVLLQEIARRRERQQVVDVQVECVKMVLVSVGGVPCAFRGECVKEILPLLPIFPVPGTPECLLGVINVRGQIESVVELTKLMGLPSPNEGPSSRIVIGEAGGIRSGVLVESVVDVLDVPAGALRPPLETLSTSIRELVAGSFQHGETLVTLLDLSKVFGKIPG